MLSNFLVLAENNAAYRPDSTLSERGPVSSSSGASTNLTLHHLNRILQGIEGKRVGGAYAFEGVFEGNEEDGSARRKRRRVDDAEAVDDEEETDAVFEQQQQRKRRRSSMNVRADATNGPFIIPEQSEAEPETPISGWQDKEQFETTRKDDEVDAMNEDRVPGAGLQQPANEKEAEEMVGVEVEGMREKVDPRPETESTQDSPVKGLDKDERRRRKKERRKEEKRREAEKKGKES